MHNFWNVLLFYQRLWLAVKYNGVQRRYIAGLLGEIFDWWFCSSSSTGSIHVIVNWFPTSSTFTYGSSRMHHILKLISGVKAMYSIPSTVKVHYQKYR